MVTTLTGKMPTKEYQRIVMVADITTADGDVAGTCIIKGFEKKLEVTDFTEELSREFDQKGKPITMITNHGAKLTALIDSGSLVAMHKSFHQAEPLKKVKLHFLEIQGGGTAEELGSIEYDDAKISHFIIEDTMQGPAVSVIIVPASVTVTDKKNSKEDSYNYHMVATK